MSVSLEIQSAIDASVALAFSRAHPGLRENYLKVAEASVQLSIHVDTLHRLVRRGDLRAVGRGKLLRIPQSAIQEYLEATSSTAVRAAVTK